MSFQSIQQMAGQTMVTQSIRLSLVAEALSYDGVPASSPEEVLQPGIPIMKAKAVSLSLSPDSPEFDRYGSSISAFSVAVDKVVKSNAPPIPRYQQGHPLANADGLVFYPDISSVQEMTDMMTAARDFDAAVTIFNTSRQMQGQVLDLVSI